MNINIFERQINYLLDEIDKYFNRNANTGSQFESETNQTDRLVNISKLIEGLKERSEVEQLNEEARNMLSGISSIEINRKVLDSASTNDYTGTLILFDIIILIRKGFHLRKTTNYLNQVDSKLRRIRQLIT